MWIILLYAAFAYFIGVGLYRWFNYRREHLFSLVVGCLGITSVLLNRYGGLLFTPASSFRLAYDLFSAFLDAIVGVGIIYLMIEEFRR
jgi:hypothetical protein